MAVNYSEIPQQYWVIIGPKNSGKSKLCNWLLQGWWFEESGDPNKIAKKIRLDKYVSISLEAQVILSESDDRKFFN